MKTTLYVRPCGIPMHQMTKDRHILVRAAWEPPRPVYEVHGVDVKEELLLFVVHTPAGPLFRLNLTIVPGDYEVDLVCRPDLETKYANAENPVRYG